MEDCFSCRVVSTSALLATSVYLVYGARHWPRAQPRFLYPLSAGVRLLSLLPFISRARAIASSVLVVFFAAGLVNWVVRGRDR